MAKTAQARFSCMFCGRQFLWKDELASRQIQCPCGQTFRAPTTQPKSGHTPEDLLADLARRSTPPPKADRPQITPTAPPPLSQSKSTAPRTIPHLRPAA